MFCIYNFAFPETYLFDPAVIKYLPTRIPAKREFLYAHMYIHMCISKLRDWRTNKSMYFKIRYIIISKYKKARIRSIDMTT